jgi:ERCC4-related helicase
VLASTKVLVSNLLNSLIENNLDSVTKTPRIHYEELAKFVHRPELQVAYFQSETPEEVDISPALISLRDLDGMKGPEGVHPLLAAGMRRLKGKSMFQKFLAKAWNVQRELGKWAADYYVAESITIFRNAMRDNGEILFGWKSVEKDQVLESLRFLRPSDLTAPATDKTPKTSAKFRKLLDILHTHHSAKFRGLIFVQQRSTVVTLSRLLSFHPESRGRFNCGTFVGISSHERKKTELGDLLDTREQMTTLDDFRSGGKNLMIATNALEEGIDISACNAVICFDEPPNFKSFIQRRGRARMEKSVFVAILPYNDQATRPEKWRELEREMIRTYQNEERELEERRVREDAEETCDRVFAINSTGCVFILPSRVS